MQRKLELGGSLRITPSVMRAVDGRLLVGGVCSLSCLLSVSLALSVRECSKPWRSKGGCFFLSSQSALVPVAMTTEIRGRELLTPGYVVSFFGSICSRCSRCS